MFMAPPPSLPRVVDQAADGARAAVDHRQRDPQLHPDPAELGTAERDRPAELGDPALDVGQAAVPAVERGTPLDAQLPRQLARVADAVVGDADGQLVAPVAEPEDGTGRLGMDGDVEERLPHGPCDVVLRSEEHTSELQSLMRISYAVFCLKKKK